jgi:hypothetical protein
VSTQELNLAFEVLSLHIDFSLKCLRFADTGVDADIRRTDMTDLIINLNTNALHSVGLIDC